MRLITPAVGRVHCRIRSRASTRVGNFQYKELVVEAQCGGLKTSRKLPLRFKCCRFSSNAVAVKLLVEKVRPMQNKETAADPPGDHRWSRSTCSREVHNEMCFGEPHFMRSLSFLNLPRPKSCRRKGITDESDHSSQQRHIDCHPSPLHPSALPQSLQPTGRRE